MFIKQADINIRPYVALTTTIVIVVVGAELVKLLLRPPTPCHNDCTLTFQ